MPRTRGYAAARNTSSGVYIPFSHISMLGGVTPQSQGRKSTKELLASRTVSLKFFGSYEILGNLRPGGRSIPFRYLALNYQHSENEGGINISLLIEPPSNCRGVDSHQKSLEADLFSSLEQFHSVFLLVCTRCLEAIWVPRTDFLPRVNDIF